MIHTNQLTRHFRVPRSGDVVEAVQGIDLHVEAGELVAFLGPNGAGKSTTLRMLTTLLAPTSGTAEVAGCDVVADPAGVRRRIGSIGQGNGAGTQQLARDELVNQGRCYGMDRRSAAARADELLAALDLTDLAERMVDSLSGGQKRRLDIALGMVNRPELLFLDEPSTGLDPQNRANLQSLVSGLRTAYGTTVVLTTHYLDEADALADRVIVIDHGRVIADDTPARLKSGLVGDRLAVDVGSAAAVGAAAAVLDRVASPMAVDVEGSTLVVRVDGAPALVPGLLRALDDAGVPVAGVEVGRATLDDVFLALTGRSLREDVSSSVPAAEVLEVAA